MNVDEKLASYYKKMHSYFQHNGRTKEFIGHSSKVRSWTSNLVGIVSKFCF